MELQLSFNTVIATYRNNTGNISIDVMEVFPHCQLYMEEEQRKPFYGRAKIPVGIMTDH
jgi:hypothetical protein